MTAIENTLTDLIRDLEKLKETPNPDAPTILDDIVLFQESITVTATLTDPTLDDMATTGVVGIKKIGFFEVV